MFPVLSKLLEVKGRAAGSWAIVPLDPALLPEGIFERGGAEGMLGMLTEGSALWLQIQVSSATPPSPHPTHPG